jgi:CubicO group peptidase (beta-lactamase class C family)
MQINGIEEFLTDQQASQRVPGMAVALASDEGDVMLHTYGTDGSGSPVTDTTLFRIGSLSKSVTAVAVLQLVEAGLLDLDDPVQQVLPEFTTADAAGSAITIRHLLNHTSGLSDRGYSGLGAERVSSLDQLVVNLNEARVTSSPGTEFAYFNANYDTLGRVIEVVSGQSYAEYIDANIFDPLGMETAVVRHVFNADDVSHLAQGHILFYGFPVRYPENLNAYAPSGGILASAADMGAYLQLFVTDDPTVLSDESIQLMLTPPEAVDSTYGMGWFEVTLPDGTTAFQHSGDVRTAHADMMLLPDEEIAFAVLYNRQHLFSVFTTYPQVRNGIADIVRGNQPATGLPASTVGIIIAVASIAIIANDVRRLLNHDDWVEETRGKSQINQLTSLIGPLFPVVLLLFLPQIMRQLLGQAIDYGTLVAYLPDVMLLLLIVSILGGLTAARRIAAMAEGETFHQGKSDT